MSLPLWIPIASLIVAMGAMLSSIYTTWLNGRARQQADEATQAARGALAARLENLESWKASSSVERPEFDDHGRRLASLETNVGDLSKLLTDVRVQMATVVATANSALELSKVQFQTLDHKLNSVRQAVERMSS